MCCDHGNSVVRRSIVPDSFTLVDSMLLSRSWHTDQDFIRVKHAAARALFALASLPEEYWGGFTAVLCKQSIKDCAVAFNFIIHTFLLAPR